VTNPDLLDFSKNCPNFNKVIPISVRIFSKFEYNFEFFLLILTILFIFAAVIYIKDILVYTPVGLRKLIGHRNTLLMFFRYVCKHTNTLKQARLKRQHDKIRPQINRCEHNTPI